MRYLSSKKALISQSKLTDDNPWITYIRRYLYPVPLQALLARIKQLAKELGDRVTLDLVTFDLSQKGELARARQQLNNKGGIYIWYCIPTGMFYLGSAMRFFGKSGRLVPYLFKGITPSPVINRNVGKALAQYGQQQFILIIVQQWTQGSVPMLNQLSFEQIWILLKPTYNMTLRTGTFVSLPMSEELRKAMSTVYYTYLVGPLLTIIPGSIQTHYGTKAIVRNGITIPNGDNIKLSLYLLYGWLKAGTLLNNQLIITTTPILDTVSWVPTLLMQYQLQKITYVGLNTHGVWVYYAQQDPNYRYTSDDLYAYYPTVGSAQKDTKIPLSTFTRVRNLLEEKDGYIYSNSQLHTDAPYLVGRKTEYKTNSDSLSPPFYKFSSV